MVADVVDEALDGLAVLGTLQEAADAGLALRERAEGGRVGQERLQELERDDLVSLVDDGVDAGHADVLEDIQVLDVVVGEGHPEARLLESVGLQVRGERFEFLMPEQVDLLRTDPGGEVVHLGELERLGLDELPVLEVFALRGDFTDVDLGVEIGGERLSVVAGVAVDDVERVDGVEILRFPRGVDIGHAGVESAAEERGDALLAEAVAVRPLPAVFEVRDVRRLVVGGVDVIDSGFEAGVHDVEVLVGQREVQDHVGAERADELDELRDVVGVDLCGLDGTFEGRCELLAF